MWQGKKYKASQLFLRTACKHKVSGSDMALFRPVLWFENSRHMLISLKLVLVFSALLCGFLAVCLQYEACVLINRAWHLMAVQREASEWKSSKPSYCLPMKAAVLGMAYYWGMQASFITAAWLNLLSNANLVSKLCVWHLSLALKEKVPHNRDLESLHHHSSLEFFYILFCNLHV